MFLATAGEEFGYTNAYYDWLTGAWWAATHAHPEWVGRVRAMINIEGMAIKDAPLVLGSNPELGPWLEGLASRHQALTPYGSEAITPVNSWNDQWTFTAAGIPSVKVSTPSDEYDTSYHSNFETAELVDWAYQAKIAKFVFRAVAGVDDGLLPYRLEARADDLAATVNTDELLAAGGDTAIVARLAAAVEAFRTAAAAFDSLAEAIPPSAIESANGGLLEIERAVNAGFTALSPAVGR